MERSQSPEKFIIGFLLIVALLTFFFPLITFQIPVFGSQDVSGYDIFSKIGEFRDKMSSHGDEVRSEAGASTDVPGRSGEPEPEPSRSPGNEPPLPISFQCIALIPLEAFLAFACALIALPGCRPGIFRRAHVKVMSAVGSLFALAAILHLTVMNSDLHAWFQESMRAASEELRGNPFPNFAETLGGIVANAFQIKPGIGLYVLAVTLALAAFLAYSRLMETVAIESEPTVLPGSLAACAPEQSDAPQQPSNEPTYSIVGEIRNPTQDESSRTTHVGKTFLFVLLSLVSLVGVAIWIYSTPQPRDSSADKVVQPPPVAGQKTRSIEVQPPPVQPYVPPIQYAPSAQAPVEDTQAASSAAERSPVEGEATLIVVVTSTRSAADTEGHTMRFATGHATADPNLELELVCDDVHASCLPLLAGKIYRLDRVQPDEPDYINGGRKGFNTFRYRGKAANAVYAVGPAR